MNDLVYVQYSKKTMERFKKRHVERKNLNLLILEEFLWDNNGFKWQLTMKFILDHDLFWSMLVKPLMQHHRYRAAIFLG